jgi:hypothetical protein
MDRKPSAAVDMSLATLKERYLGSAQKIAKRRDDKALNRDSSALWDEMVQVLGPVGALPPNDLVIPDDWPDRPAGEGQRYMRAQLALNFARNYTDSGWRTLEQAVDRGEKARRYLQDQAEALKITETSKRELQRMAAEDEIKVLETRLEDLGRRQSEILRRQAEGQSLDDSVRRELSGLALESDDTRVLLQSKRMVLEIVYNPGNASLLYDFEVEVLKRNREELNTVQKNYAAVAARRRIRWILRWGWMALVAIAIFVLGKFSDDLLAWPLAAAAAFVLWLVDVKLAEPCLQRKAAKRVRKGLVADIKTMYKAKHNIRLQQAEYNEKLRKAGIGEVALFPVASQAPLDSWFRDLIRDVWGSDLA